jgi:hypothetical protein
MFFRRFTSFLFTNPYKRVRAVELLMIHGAMRPIIPTICHLRDRHNCILYLSDRTINGKIPNFGNLISSFMCMGLQDNRV